MHMMTHLQSRACARVCWWLAVYTVKISRHPHCDCPDHAKGNLCKHILFVLLRVLKLGSNNPLAWQKALLTKEVRGVPCTGSRLPC